MKSRIIKLYSQLVPRFAHREDNRSTFLFFLAAPIFIVFGLLCMVRDVCWLIWPAERHEGYIPFVFPFFLWGMAGFVLYMLRADRKKQINS